MLFILPDDQDTSVVANILCSISHHILSLYGTGASVEDIEKGYKDNSSYQRPVIKPHDDPAQTLRDWETAKKRLGKEQLV